MTPAERLEILAARVDAFFDRVAARHASELACAPGCDSCCRRRLTVTGVEAAAITRGLAAMAPEARAAIAAAAGATSDVCAALGDDGRCSIYALRPLVCRSHGVPIRFRAPDPRSLPVLDACSKNFIGVELATLDPADILDQETLSTMLAALDAADADEHGRPRGERFDLAALLDDAEVSRSGRP